MAARQVAAAPAQHGLQYGEELEHLVGHRVQLAGQRREAGHQVLAHGQQREDLAALRHVGDAGAGAGMGGQAGDVAVAPQDAAGADRLVAHDGAQQRGLAHPVAAQHAGNAARRGMKRHAPQRLGGAVEKIDGIDGQHGPNPREINGEHPYESYASHPSQGPRCATSSRPLPKPSSASKPSPPC